MTVGVRGLPLDSGEFPAIKRQRCHRSDKGSQPYLICIQHHAEAVCSAMNLWRPANNFGTTPALLFWESSSWPFLPIFIRLCFFRVQCLAGHRTRCHSRWLSVLARTYPLFMGFASQP